MRTLRALPTLMRIGFSEAIAYRAEMFVWVLATTMPFVMLVMWSAVAEANPVLVQGRSWGSPQFIAYFLSMFIARQLIAAWAAWEINWEVRGGLLAMRLLRPMHPIISYAAQNVAAMPLRVAVTLPIALVLAFSDASQFMCRDWRIWCLVPFAFIGGWLITFFANIVIGSLALFMESSTKIMDVWLAMFFVFSGYLFPTDLFPDWLRAIADVLPFRYQIGLPVELMTGRHEVSEALALMGRQYAFAALFIGGALMLWRRGITRFQAYGG